MASQTILTIIFKNMMGYNEISVEFPVQIKRRGRTVSNNFVNLKSSFLEVKNELSKQGFIKKLLQSLRIIFSLQT